MKALAIVLWFWLGADPEPMPRPVIGVTESDADELDEPESIEPEPIFTAEGVSSVVYGHGRFAEARVVSRDRYQLELRGAWGWTTIVLDDFVPHSGTYYTLEDMRWVDVVGDGAPELWVEINSYRDPCGCDGGPTFSSNEVIVCRASQRGPVCSAPITTGGHSHGSTMESFSGELRVSRSGMARLHITSSEGYRASELSRLTRPRRLFR